jgi:hypothetical protein
MILHSPILSGLRVLTENRLLCCFDIFPNIDRIQSVKCPVFVIHGMRDEEVAQRRLIHIALSFHQVGVHHGMGLFNAVPDQYQYEPW